MRNTEMVLLDILFQDLKIILLSRIYIYRASHIILDYLQALTPK